MAAEMFPPGDFIEEELEARGWSKGDLASIMGRPAQLISSIISGKRVITLETAEDLAAAFGTSAEFWVNLDTSYRLWKKRMDERGGERDEVRARAKIYSIAPVNELVRRRWIPDVKTDPELQDAVLNFLEITTVDEQPVARFAARKSTDDVNNSQIAWFKRACQLASAVKVSTFSKSRIGDLIEQLKPLAKNKEDVRHVPEVLSNFGIRMLIVEHLPKTKIDGAAFWLSKSEPVIALSMRHGRIDSFWFTLGHELGHIDAGHEQSLDNDLINEGPRDADVSDQERVADNFASEMLISQDRLNNFISRKGKYFSKDDIKGFAHVVGVHPGIVVGQLQYRHAIRYSHSREMLETIREIITEAALTDGWGKSTPI